MDNTSPPLAADPVTDPTGDAVEAHPLAWLAPGYRSGPAEALARIRAMCELIPALYGAMFAVLATHQSVPKEILAAAVKQFRRDTDGLSQDDVVGLMTSILNGSRSGFDAVLRSRKTGERKAISTPWVKD